MGLHSDCNIPYFLRVQIETRLRRARVLLEHTNMTRHHVRPSLPLLGAAMLLLASSSSAQDGYSAAWDFSNANSKLDAMAQAQTSSIFNLFNPDQAFIGAEAEHVR